MPRRKRSAVFLVQGRYTTALDNGLNVNEKKIESPEHQFNLYYN